MSDNSKLPWGVTSFQPGSLKTITTDKLATFAIGNNKKSRFQKLKEEKEAKEKAEAEAAAEVYNSFVASFEGDDNDDDDNNRQNMPMKSFIKEGSSKTNNMDSLFNEMKQKEIKNDSNNNNNNNNNNKQNFYNNEINNNKSNRVKEMDLFLEELKNKNSNEKTYTSVEYEDDFSTNLYIGNINPNITEERLYQLFSKYGEINSIKIMWPRTEEERLKRRNCGFISFMKRKVY